MELNDLNGVNGGRPTGWVWCLTRAGGMWNSYNLVEITPGNHDIIAIGRGHMHEKRPQPRAGFRGSHLIC